jgi:uncharacterized repeat protein (TIGR01451 family)
VVVDTADEVSEDTLTVDNSGNVALTGVVLDDVFAGGTTLASGDDGAYTIGTLTPKVQFSSTFTGATFPRGQHTDTEPRLPRLPRAGRR